MVAKRSEFKKCFFGLKTQHATPVIKGDTLYMSDLSTLYQNLGLEVEKNYSQTAIISMTARVGSTAFVSGLGTCNLSSRPIREIFNPRSSMKDLFERFQPASLVHYLNQYNASNSTEFLVFKTNWIDFSPVILAVGDDFNDVFPEVKFVHIERRDKVAQAYSLWKANKFNIWHREKGADYKSPVVEKVPLEIIRQHLSNLHAEELRWRQYFLEQSIVPHCVYFEEIVEDLSKSVTHAYEFFTGNAPENTPTSSMYRTSDEHDEIVLSDLRSRLSEGLRPSDDEDTSV